MDYYKEISELCPSVQFDALHMLLGEKLGSGSTRRVYENYLNPLQVVKVDMGGQFANIMEWKLWQDLSETELGKWLAPCDFISPAGEILIQRKTHQPKNFPTWIPSIFCDLKLTNFGVLPGSDQLVCHDYAMIFLEKALAKSHLRFAKANWWRLGE